MLRGDYSHSLPFIVPLQSLYRELFVSVARKCVQSEGVI